MFHPHLATSGLDIIVEKSNGLLEIEDLTGRKPAYGGDVPYELGRYLARVLYKGTVPISVLHGLHSQVRYLLNGVWHGCQSIRSIEPE